jgi:hypothetical protein
MAAPKSGKTGKKIIDVEQLEKCAEKQWSITEIAAFFRCSVDTIERRFAENIRAARQRGTAKLRDLQWKRALEGSDKMIIHMSEHYMEQHQKIEQTVVTADDKIRAMSDEELDARLKKLDSDI